MHKTYIPKTVMSKIDMPKGSRKKRFFFNGSAIKTFTPPPSSLMAIRTFILFYFLVINKPETDFDNFCTKRAIFLRKYFKKPVKDCEFANQQHNLKGGVH